jgi:bile salt-stimulated lipase
MVFIHGGGFRDGSGSPFLYGPQYLTKHDVILVTFNYRLEVLGFLCLGIEEAPGNAGLKDQVAALSWVKRNIKQFGGDPDNITIFGESAGSASVMYHLISPMSKGLFDKAIMQSGSAVSPWSFQYDPLETASLLTKQMGYETKDPHEIYKVFMDKTPEELLSARVPRLVGDIVLSENIFVPCLEKIIPGVQQFLPNLPYDLISKGLYNKVPIIIGHNNAEGYMFAGKENDTTISKMNFYAALPRDLEFPTQKQKIETANKLQKLYMGDEKITKETLVRFSFYEGESCITYPVIAATDILASTNNMPVYSYKFSYDGWMNYAKLYFGYSAQPGATHADELFFMFKFGLPLLLHEYNDWDIVQKMSTMWTNFAKYG